LQLLEDKVNKSKSKSKSEAEKIDYNEISKYLPEPPSDDPNTILDDSVIKQRIESALNAKRAEEDAKLRAKEREKELLDMERYEKQQKEQSKREAEYRARLPERQLQMLLSGKRSTCSFCHMRQRAEFFGHTNQCPAYRATDIEPGLALLREEYSTGRIIRRFLGEQTHDRLVEFAKDEETYPDLINRLLDIAASAEVAPAVE
jgi:hypothetical protein